MNAASEQGKIKMRTRLICFGIGACVVTGHAADDPALIAKGEQLFLTKICATCHQVKPDQIAPAGIAMKAPKFIGDFWGKERDVTMGFGGPVKKVNFDDAYFIESIRNPIAKIAKEAAAPMPPPPQVDDNEMKALIAYVKSLSGARGGKGALKDLTYKLYEGTWNKLPDFSTLTPKLSGAVSDGLIDQSISKNRDAFGLVFEGKLAVPKEGTYTFRLGSDDGSRLEVNGKEIILIDGVHPVIEKEGSAKLNVGEHVVRVSYFENGGGEHLGLSVRGPGIGQLQLARDSVAIKTASLQTGMPIEPADGEAVIYRNFIEGASPRGIGVGYPEKLNLCFDANTMQLAMLWQGAFMDGARHWSGRGNGFQPPSGFYVIKLLKDQPFALLANAEAPWPKIKVRAEGIQFRGYRLAEQRRPVFLYDVGSVRVEDFATPVAGEKPSFIRQLTLSDGGEETLSYLAAADATIVEKGGGYKIGKDLWVTFPGWTGPAPLIRENGGRKELLLQIPLKKGAAKIRQQYHWDLE